MGGWRVLLCVALGSLTCHIATADYADGDFVTAARRGQFHGSRTQWHDLLGRHCPRFAVETKVAVPIPRPKAHKTVLYNYKIQFEFDGGRVLTPWVQIIGRNSPTAPVVNIELEHRDRSLTAARAEVKPLNSEYLREHQTILREFQNATLWPKHLLVHYTWKHEGRIHATAGLFLIFAMGAITTLTLALSVIISYREKLEAFLEDLTSEQPWSHSQSVGKPQPVPLMDGGKAD